MCQETQQSANKGMEQEDYKLVNMDVNNTGFKMVRKTALQIFYEEETAVNMFVCPQAYTQCVLVSNRECKYNFCIFTRTLHRAPCTFLAMPAA